MPPVQPQGTPQAQPVAYPASGYPPPQEYPPSAPLPGAVVPPDASTHAGMQPPPIGFNVETSQVNSQYSKELNLCLDGQPICNGYASCLMLVIVQGESSVRVCDPSVVQKKGGVPGAPNFNPIPPPPPPHTHTHTCELCLQVKNSTSCFSCSLWVWLLN
jgi:hypothetical protein